MLKVAKARHILSLGDKLMSSDRPDTVVVDPGIFSDDSTYSSRSSLGSISLSSSFLSVASLPAGKPLRFTRDVNPEKVKEKLLNKVSINLRTFIISGLSLRAGGRGFSPATKRVAPGYFYWKIEEK